MADTFGLAFVISVTGLAGLLCLGGMLAAHDSVLCPQILHLHCIAGRDAWFTQHWICPAVLQSCIWLKASGTSRQVQKRF